MSFAASWPIITPASGIGHRSPPQLLRASSSSPLKPPTPSDQSTIAAQSRSPLPATECRHLVQQYLDSTRGVGWGKDHRPLSLDGPKVEAE